MTAPLPLPQATDRTTRLLRRASCWWRDHPQAIMVAILLLALALRVYRLADKNIWWDEGSSAWQAPLSLAEITLYQARDQHPPLYYWLLHGWYRGMGASLTSLRLFSALWGVLGVGGAYALGRRLLGQPQAAWMGAFLLAISRFHIEWSQEIKMYAMVSTLSMLSLLLAVELARRTTTSGPEDRPHGRTTNARRVVHSAAVRRVSLWGGYVLVTAAAVYTHYIALLVVAAQNVALVAWVVLRWRRSESWKGPLAAWVASQALVAASMLPWLLLRAEHNVTWSPAPVQPFAEMLRMVATLLAAGTSLHVERYTAQTALLWLVAGITLLGWSQAARARSTGGEGPREGVLALWITLLVPWLLTYLLTLPVFRLGYESKLAARFFLLCQTPFSLLLAAGLNAGARRWPWSPWVGLLGAVLLLAWPLQSYYEGRYLRDDYGTLADTIEAYGQPGDAVLLMNDSEWPVFRYEYGGALPVYQVPYGAAGGDKLIRPYVQPAWERNDGLWVVTIGQALEQDPGRAVGAWLTQQGQRVLDQSFGERTLTLYRKTRLSLRVDDAYRPQYALDAAPVAGLRLEGYDQPLAEARTGRALRLATTWRVEGAAPAARLRAVLVGRQGRTAGSASEWATLHTGDAASARQRLRTDIPISTAVASGCYTVRLLLQSSAGESLGQVDLGMVRVVRTMGDEAAAATNPTDYRLGPSIILQGYDLERSTVRAGETLRLALYWRAEAKVEGEYTVFVQVMGQTMNPRTGNPLWGQVDRLPLEGKYPTSSWLAGDGLVDRYVVPVSPQAPAGEYELVVGLYAAATGERLPVADGSGRALGDHVLLKTITVR